MNISEILEDRQTNWPTKGPTDQQKDQRTNKGNYYGPYRVNLGLEWKKIPKVAEKSPKHNIFRQSVIKNIFGKAVSFKILWCTIFMQKIKKIHRLALEKTVD